MTVGFVSPPPAETPSHAGRVLEPAEWAAAGIPLLRSPRELVAGLHTRHRPGPATSVVAVLGPDERIIASASFSRANSTPDGWECRNVLLSQMRRIVPHDLRRRRPSRTAVLLCCREDDPGWSDEDGAWMWGLRDACILHGLRCGAYITVTRTGWQVLGEDRGGRRPYVGGPAAWDTRPESGGREDGALEKSGPQGSGPGKRAPGRSGTRRGTTAR
ncbi:hypothetical protein L7D48_09720 [Streptomyces sp. S1A]|uniref:hypothetical protein n=1 Tax=Streptomyces sp. ICN903 TaxID=2964654 RepID=UPI001EDBDE60|nr:hypothetical protein [Streptomyces sp. ICN903]MCG3040845.1 hypothetical protein [Streptomyces sp. ICN903]